MKQRMKHGQQRIKQRLCRPRLVWQRACPTLMCLRTYLNAKPSWCCHATLRFFRRSSRRRRRLRVPSLCVAFVAAAQTISGPMPPSLWFV